MDLVDTHCHIQFDKYKDPGLVVADAQAGGVSKLICVGTTLADSRRAIKLATEHGAVWATVGTHPHGAMAVLGTQQFGSDFRKLLKRPKVVAVGEIGLDFYKNYSSCQDQKKALRLQIEASLDSRLPFIFHIREAWQDFWPIFDSYSTSGQPIKGVIHSFSAHREQLGQILKRGLYVDLNGIMTFTTDEKQLESAQQIPLDKLLLETDAPFLTPKPFRGEICQPKHVRTIAEFLAELRDEPLQKLASQTTKNAASLFKFGTNNG
jgi:TatD DNase family protein